MDQQARAAERAFRAAPSVDTAAPIFQHFARAGGWPEAAGRWVLDASRWDELPRDLQELTGRCLGAAMTPKGFVFESLVRHALGGLAHRVVMFTREGRRFALLPGGRARLGLDVHELRPGAEHVADVRSWCEALGGDEAAGGDVGRVLTTYYPRGTFTRPREANLDPFLIETEPRPLQALVAEEDWGDEIILDDGAGGRLPTSDEWEYACGGGRPRLFRWGDDCPVAEDPHAARKFRLHRRPNAFGLTLPHDTYQTELCQGGRLRGGDGGDHVCGGSANFLSWLTLASARDYTPELAQLGLSLHECYPVARFVHALPSKEAPAPEAKRRATAAKSSARARKSPASKKNR